MNQWPEGGSGLMLRLIAALPDQIRQSASLVGLDDVRPVPWSGRLVLCGMGGSAIAGDLVQPALFDGEVTLTVWRDYGLPHWVRREDIVICASYSGNTEETLSAAEDAHGLGCRRVAISSGGALTEIARAEPFPVVMLPGGLPPRASLGLGLGALVRVLERLGAIADAGTLLATTADALDGSDWARRQPWGPGGDLADARPDGNPSVAELARELAGRVPVIYTCGRESHAAGLRLKAQLNENSKVPALLAAFPELDHNDLVGWCLEPGDRDRFALLILRAGAEHPRIALRVAATRELLADQFALCREIRGVGPDPLSRVMSLVQYGDYLSTHLAMARGVDPVPVERIVRLKEVLARAQE